MAGSTWRWRFEGAEGARLDDAELPTEGFSTQGDAESWVGEVWRDLLDRGVLQVSLLEDDRVVYGPMSLLPAPDA